MVLSRIALRLFSGALSTASSVALLAGRGTNRLLTGLCCKPIFNTIASNERIRMSDNARIDIRGKSVDLAIVEAVRVN